MVIIKRVSYLDDPYLLSGSTTGSGVQSAGLAESITPESGKLPAEALFGRERPSVSYLRTFEFSCQTVQTSPKKLLIEFYILEQSE